MKRLFTLLLPLLSVSANAANAEFIDFAVKQAHKRQYYGCENAIKEVYKTADGSDIRISGSTYKDTNPNVFTMTAVWGSKGDSVLNNTIFIKTGKKCMYSSTINFTTKKNCLTYAQEMQAFKFEAETGDHTWMKNSGGVELVLSQLPSSCNATFIISGLK